jgi:hypothetical protein
VKEYTADVIPPSTALAFVTKMSEKRKSISPCAIQVQNQQKTISSEEKLYAKGDRIVDMCHNVTFAHISICTFCDNADRITESAVSGNKDFV